MSPLFKTITVAATTALFTSLFTTIILTACPPRPVRWQWDEWRARKAREEAERIQAEKLQAKFANLLFVTNSPWDRSGYVMCATNCSSYLWFGDPQFTKDSIELGYRIGRDGNVPASTGGEWKVHTGHTAG